MKRLIATVLFFFFFSACSHVKVDPEPVPPVSQDVFWSSLKDRYEAASAVTGKVWVKYKGKRESISGKGRFTFRFPKEGRWELRDPLGRVQFLAIVSPADFTAFYPTQKLAYHDESEGMLYSKQFLSLEMGFPEIQRMIIGLLPQTKESIKGLKFVEWSWDAKRGMYRGILGRLEPMNVYVSNNGREIREIEWPLGSDVLRVKYGDYEACCENKEKQTPPFSFPFSANIVLEKAKTAVQVIWDSVDSWSATGSEGENAFQMSLPEGTTVRQLK